MDRQFPFPQTESRRLAYLERRNERRLKNVQAKVGSLKKDKALTHQSENRINLTFFIMMEPHLRLPVCHFGSCAILAKEDTTENQQTGQHLPAG